jgi:hypothetical protein
MYISVSICYVYQCIYIYVYIYTYIYIYILNISCIRIREINKDGAVAVPANMVQELGFQVGQWVQRKADEVKAKILAFKGTDVLIMVEGIKSSVPMAGFLHKEWSHCAETSAAIVQANLKSVEPTLYVEFQLASIRAIIQRELYVLSETHVDMLSMLEVQLTPKKELRCTCNIAVGKLLLVPSTLKITHTKTDVDGMLKVQTQMKGWTFALGPFSCGNAGFIAPFFMVQSDHDENKVNMDIVMVKASSDNSIKIPLLKNIVTLKTGDVLFQKSAVKKAKSVDPIKTMDDNNKKKRSKSVDPEAKRSKTS